MGQLHFQGDNQGGLGLGLDPIPLGGFVDAWARRKWIMAQDLGIYSKMALMVLEAHADIQTGRVIGPSGPRFTLRDLGILGSMGHSVLSDAIRHLEEGGYLRVIRHQFEGLASEYFLTHPIRVADTPIRVADTPIRVADTPHPPPIHVADMRSPRKSLLKSPLVSGREERSQKKILFYTVKEYENLIEEGIRQFEEGHHDDNRASP